MRYRSLDSLRGIAALVVVAHHCAITMFGLVFPNWIRFSPLRVLLDGKAAVLIFFALSGFVLFLSVWSTKKWRYVAYLSKRFARLYVPFAVAIVASALLYVSIKPHFVALLGPNNRSWWQSPPTFGLVLAHLAMTDLERFQGLDAVMWSLCHEARISLIFPIVAFAVVRDWRLAVVTCLAVSYGSAIVVQHTALPWTYNPFLTLQYLFLFAGAAAVASHTKTIGDWFAGVAPWARIGMWTFALIGVTFSLNPLVGFVSDFAAIAIVALCFCDPFAVRMLSHAIPTWLGRVSYSLYLVHLPILLASVHLLYRALPLPMILAIAVVLSLGVAEFAYRWVERPAIELGRRVADRLQSRARSIGRDRVSVGW